jgi:hypothetical protein
MLVEDNGAIVEAWPVSFRGWRSQRGDPEPADLAAPGA